LTRGSFRKQMWRELNRPVGRSRAPWYVPKIPSILQMGYRCFALFMLNIGLWAIEIVLIQGEDVFWTFNFVDQFYTNFGSNPQDASTLVTLATWFIIWGPLAIVVVLGYWDRWTAN